MAVLHPTRRRESDFMKRFVLLFIISLASFNFGLSQTIVDRIVAVVDKEIITESDLAERTNLVAMQNRLDPKSKDLRKQVLDGMIAEKLILAQAALDSVEVSENEITQSIEQQIQNMIRQAGSEERIEQYYGIPISRIKREFRGEMKKQLLVNRVRQKKESEIQVSLREVQEFYETHKDSLPVVPEEVELSNIFMVPKPDADLEKKTRLKLLAIRDSVKKGGDFADFALKYSQHPTGSRGGELPWAKRGELLREFEEVTFSLKENELSDIFKTELGFHLVQLLERRGESVRVRQIILPLEKGEASDSVTVKELRELKSRILNGEPFEKLAKEFSEDEDTKAYGGNLGRIGADQLEDEFSEVVKSLKEGEISDPHRVNVGNSYGFQIVWLRKQIPAHPMNIKDDFRRVEQFALYFKRNKIVDEWILSLREKIYWEIRL